MRVLIAEDDPIIALGLETKLAALGHDVVMPGLDGLEAACAITRERPVPIVAITAHDQPEYLDRAIRCGVAAYLVKPVDARQVERALRLAVSRHGEFEAMRTEVGRLQDALETRRLVERAKGILMDRFGLAESDAFLRIQRRSRDTNRTMADVARQLIDAAELLPTDDPAPT